jgi:hypothetical protein
MLTRRAVAHQYGAGGYYPAPYHVAMPAAAYPDEGRPACSRSTTPPAMLFAYYHGPRPYVGMDPSDPSTWSRPYNPQEGMFGRFHADQAAAARRVRRG